MLMINGLACLLIITSLCVIMVRTAKKAALFYSLQSLVLVLLFVYLANEMQAHELYSPNELPFFSLPIMWYPPFCPYCLASVYNLLGDTRQGFPTTPCAACSASDTC